VIYNQRSGITATLLSSATVCKSSQLCAASVENFAVRVKPYLSAINAAESCYYARLLKFKNYQDRTQSNNGHEEQHQEAISLIVR